MPAYRYYIDSPLKEKEVTLKGAEHQHLKKVMKQREQEPAELINGRGSLAYATIQQIEKNETFLRIDRVDFYPITYKFILFQALTSPSHLEVIVEKGTELGMTELVLFRGTNSTGYFSDQKSKRLEIKIIAALKQSGRVYLPTIKWIENLDSIRSNVDFSCFGDVAKDAPPLFQVLPAHDTLKSFSFCSGPERGFTELETEALKKMGFLGISLHSNILRAETAPLTFLSLIHHYLRLQRNGTIIN